MSYDDTGTLARFAAKRGITFPLLSDPGSATIEAYGLRNLEVQGSRVDGIPYPGTILVDREGTVRARLFHEGYERRHAAADIIEAAAGLP